ncbi:hypothetical protein KQ302_08390 [Synechococcus sp. CS-602]|uniref:hypothetical protein n=1 Tax=Synechococcaceae TaxID=1890426 RepID=UPI0011ABAD91|nr:MULTISPECIES: hypothetical protein [Synechococcaceae]MCT0205111.1 hypothetical protein [Synechococcus sp. CS-602]MCT4367367.1 hypothetical protein [Candidatus Regnicoccus frigidus MAG-AL2]TWB95175.1 hypothetical protein FB106_102213 [Synechococcus sp. Ace-Pa]
MDRGTGRLVGIAAIVFPILHSITDGMEWLQGGFSALQLWLNYLAFLPMPAIMLGLYALQRPQIGKWGLIGALLYGFAFVYFAFTTLYALTAHIPTYEQLWTSLGWVYTAHGAVMVYGGLCFGFATARSSVFPWWTARLFLIGIVLNFLLALVPVPDLLQTLGTVLRNAGLVGMGWAVVNRRSGNGEPPSPLKPSP